MDHTWPGVIDVEMLKASHVARINTLADEAKSGNWKSVLTLLESDIWLSPNQWRIGGKSLFTPLHQAAWLGAPVETVEQLLALGAWRSLRNADGDRPTDLARKRGHVHLLELLDVHAPGEYEQRKFTAWDRHLAGLIAERTERLQPVKFRPVPTEVIALEPLENLWFSYPGMYGGFGMSIHKNRLFVESWCRVAGGSGQAHVITESGCVLVEEGFI